MQIAVSFGGAEAFTWFEEREEQSLEGVACADDARKSGDALGAVVEVIEADVGAQPGNRRGRLLP